MPGAHKSLDDAQRSSLDLLERLLIWRRLSAKSINVLFSALSAPAVRKNSFPYF
jgi:hypothetical protein